MNAIITSVNAVYRSYDSVCVSAEQFYHYLLPIRTLLAYLGVDIATLLTLWLSYGIEPEQVVDQPIYLAASSAAPWVVGYVLPIEQDLTYLWHYSAQVLEFALYDLGAAVRGVTVSTYQRLAGIVSAFLGALYY